MLGEKNHRPSWVSRIGAGLTLATATTTGNAQPAKNPVTTPDSPVQWPKPMEVYIDDSATRRHDPAYDLVQKAGDITVATRRPLSQSVEPRKDGAKQAPETGTRSVIITLPDPDRTIPIKSIAVSETALTITRFGGEQETVQFFPDLEKAPYPKNTPTSITLAGANKVYLYLRVPLNQTIMPEIILGPAEKCAYGVIPGFILESEEAGKPKAEQPAREKTLSIPIRLAPPPTEGISKVIKVAPADPMLTPEFSGLSEKFMVEIAGHISALQKRKKPQQSKGFKAYREQGGLLEIALLDGGEARFHGTRRVVKGDGFEHEPFSLTFTVPDGKTPPSPPDKGR